MSLRLASTWPPGTSFFEGNGPPLVRAPSGKFFSVLGDRVVELTPADVEDKLRYRKFGDATYSCTPEQFDAEVREVAREQAASRDATSSDPRD